MKFTIPSIIYQNAALLWLGVTLLFWWAGFAGRDIYLLPALVFFGVSVYQVFQGTFSNNSIIWLYKYSNKRYFLTVSSAIHGFEKLLIF